MESSECIVKMYAVVLLIASVYLCRTQASSLSLILGFGASTIDTGNNNYINTTIKANFPPYGRDFPSHIATGRFSNGKLAIDFLSQYIGAKDTVPPYLNPGLKISDLLTGVSFASAGSGFDNLTGKSASVITLSNQLQLFHEYKSRVVKAVGQGRALDLLSRALFLINHGTNDLFFTYFSSRLRRNQYTLQRYQQFLLQAAQSFIAEVVKEGATKVGIIGVPPLGNLPAHKFLLTNQTSAQQLNRAAYDFNLALRSLAHNLSLQLPSPVKVVYVDIYNIISEIIRNPAKHGFEETVEPCYGGSLNKSLCPDASKYVFWNALHVTQSVYKIQADIILRRDVLRLLEKEGYRKSYLA